MRVLVVHPSTARRDELGRGLKRAGHDPILAADARQALAVEPAPEATVLALALPGTDGLQLLRELSGTDGKGHAGRRVIVLNDVYPSARPRMQFFQDYGATDVIDAAAGPDVLKRTLGRSGTKARKKGASPIPVKLADTPLPSILADLARQRASGLLYIVGGPSYLFVGLRQGLIVSLVGAPDALAGEGLELMRSALSWQAGEAVFSEDPNVSERAPLWDTHALLGRLLGGSSPLLAKIAARALGDEAKSLLFVSRRQDQPSLLTLSERRVLALLDGERSAGRVIAIAEASGIEGREILYRLELLGSIERRSAQSAAPERVGWQEHVRPLPARVADYPRSGRIGCHGLAALLLRLEAARADGVVAIKQDERAIELKLRDGRVVAGHAWGGIGRAEGHVAELVSRGDLKPDDVPAIRELDGQRLVLEALSMPRSHYSLRALPTSGASATGGVNPAAAIAEALRCGKLAPLPGSGPLPAPGEDLADAFMLGEEEIEGLAASMTGASHDSWVTTIISLLSPSMPLLLELAGTRSDAAADVASPVRKLDGLFEAALGPGEREPQVPATVTSRAAETAPADKAAAGPPAAVPARGRGRVAERQESGEATPALGVTASEIEVQLERERALRREALQEAEAVRGTFGELESFVSELQVILKDRERQLASASQDKGELEGIVAGIQGLIPMKEQELEAAVEHGKELASIVERARASARERERLLEDLRSEADRSKVRAAQLEARLAAREQEFDKIKRQREDVGERLELTRGELTAVLKRQEELESLLRTQRSDAESGRTEVARLKTELAQSEGKLRSAVTGTDARLSDVAALKSEVGILRSRLDEAESTSARRVAEVERAERERKGYEERARQVGLLLEERTAEVMGVRDEVAARTQRARELERSLDGVGAQLDARQRELLEVKEELNHSRADFEARASEMERLNAMRGEVLRQLDERARELEQQRGVSAELARERREIQAELELHVEEEKRRLVQIQELELERDELKEQLLGSRGDRSRIDDERERFIAECERLGAELDRQQAKASRQREEFEAQLKARAVGLNALSGDHESATNELAQLREALDDARLTLRTRERERDDMRERAQKLEVETSELRRRLDESHGDGRQRAEDFAKRIDEMGARLRGAEVQIVELEAGVAEAREEAKSRRVELEAGRQRISESDSRLEEAEHRREQAEAARARLKGEVDEERAAKERLRLELSERLETRAESVASLSAELNRRLSELGRLRDAHALDRSRSDHLVRARDEALSRTQTVEEKLGRLEAELESVRADAAARGRQDNASLEGLTAELELRERRARRLEASLEATAKELELRGQELERTREAESLASHQFYALFRKEQAQRAVTAAAGRVRERAQRAALHERELRYRALRGLFREEIRRAGLDWDSARQELERQLRVVRDKAKAFEAALVDAQERGAGLTKLAAERERAIELLKGDKASLERAVQAADQKLQRALSESRAEAQDLREEQRRSRAEFQQTLTVETSKLARLEQQIAQLASEDNKLREDLEVRLNENIGLKQRIFEMDAEGEERVGRLDRKLQSRDESIARLESELGERQAKLATAEAQIRDFEAELSRLSGELSVRDRSLAEGLATFERSASEWATAQSLLEAGVTTHEAESRRIQAALDAEREQTKTLEQELVGLRRRSAIDTRRTAELTSLTEDLKRQVETWEARIRTQTAELEGTKGGRRKLEVGLAALETEHKAAKEALERRGRELEGSRAEALELSAQVRQLSESLKEQEELARTHKTQLGELTRDRDRAAAEAARELERERAEVGELKKEREAARKQLESLKLEQKQTAVKQKDLGSRVVKQEAEQSELIARMRRGQEAFDTTRSTLEIKVTENAMLRRSLEKMEPQLTSLKAELGRLGESKLRLEKMLAQARAEAEEATRGRRDAGQKLKETEAGTLELKRQLEEARAAGEREERRQSSELVELKTQLSSAVERSAGLQRPTNDLAAELHDSGDARLTALEAEIAQRDQGLTELAAERKKLEARFGRKSIEASRLSTEVKQLRSEKEELERELAAERTQRAEAQVGLEAWLAQSVRDKDRVAAALERCTTEATDLEAKLQQRVQRVKAMEKGIASLTAASGPTRAKLEEELKATVGERSQMERALETARGRAKDLTRDIAERNRLIQTFHDRREADSRATASRTPARARVDADVAETGEE